VFLCVLVASLALDDTGEGATYVLEEVRTLQTLGLLSDLCEFLPRDEHLSNTQLCDFVPLLFVVDLA
jgi:hypothetical protein